MSTTHPTRSALVALAGVLLVAGCGARIDDPSQATDSAVAVRVSNCGAPLTVPRTPSRAVTNDTGITEMMFALGLADRMAGYTTYEGKERDVATSPWRADFGSTRSLGTAFTREVIQAADPDFVFAGWNYGFKESTGVTPDWIRGIGATPYQLTEACRQPGSTRRGITRPLDALYDDLTNLGRIFGVRERAAALVRDYRAEVARAAGGAPSADRGHGSSSSTVPTRPRSRPDATPDPTRSSRRRAESTPFTVSTTRGPPSRGRLPPRPTRR
jgi:iron complex transport system substrate-binding protein